MNTTPPNSVGGYAGESQRIIGNVLTAAQIQAAMAAAPVGSVAGAVGSVVGAVGSVAGAVGSVAGNVVGSVGSVIASSSEAFRLIHTLTVVSLTSGGVEKIIVSVTETGQLYFISLKVESTPAGGASDIQFRVEMDGQTVDEWEFWGGNENWTENDCQAMSIVGDGTSAGDRMLLPFGGLRYGSSLKVTFQKVASMTTGLVSCWVFRGKKI